MTDHLLKFTGNRTGGKVRVSSTRVDRAGDIVKGPWRIPNKVPLDLEHTTEPLGWLEDPIETEAGLDFGRIEFLPEGTSEKADLYRKLWEMDYPLGFSIEAIPGKVKQIETGYEFSNPELLRVAATIGPASYETGRIRNALSEAQTKLFKSLTTEHDDMTEATAEQTVETTEQTVETTEKTFRPVAPAFIGKASNRGYDLARLMRHASGEHIDAGLELEWSTELHHRHQQTNPEVKRGGFSVPLASIFKATSGASGGSADKLTGEDLRRDMLIDVADAVAADLLAQKLGIQTVATRERSFVIPRVTTKLAAEVVALDGSLSDAGQPTIDDISATPSTVGVLASVLRSAMYTQVASDVVARQIKQALVEKLDQIIVGPRSAAPTPTGLLDTTGSTAATQTDIDASTAQADALLIKQQLQEYLANSEAGSWVLRPKFVDTLRSTQISSGLDRAVIESNMLAGQPVVSSYALGEAVAATSHHAMFGDFSSAYLVVFGDSVDLQINPYGASDWAKGSVSMRALMDIGFVQSDASRVLRFTTAV